MSRPISSCKSYVSLPWRRTLSLPCTLPLLFPWTIQHNFSFCHHLLQEGRNCPDHLSSTTFLISLPHCADHSTVCGWFTTQLPVAEHALLRFQASPCAISSLHNTKQRKTQSTNSKCQERQTSGRRLRHRRKGTHEHPEAGSCEGAERRPHGAKESKQERDQKRDLRGRAPT